MPQRPGQTSANWRDLLRQRIVGLEYELLTKDPQATTGSRSSLGLVLPGLGIVDSITLMPQTIRRTKQLLADGNDNLRLIIAK